MTCSPARFLTLLAWLMSAACLPSLEEPAVEARHHDHDGDTFTEDEGDCDDDEERAYPGLDEVCGDGIDNDCDGFVDDAGAVDATDWYPDFDGDGWGREGTAFRACEAPADYVETSGDCNDGRADVYPGAVEVCDELDIDEDCDGLADDEQTPDDAPLWYADDDEDGWGDEDDPGEPWCDPPAGLVDRAGDCDDGAAGVNPGAVEVCDEDDVDEDCDDLVDDADPETARPTWYPDADTDGFGDHEAAGTTSCDPPDTGLAQVDNALDCDDGDRLVHPDAAEVCDAEDVDEDCSGASDDADPGLSSADKPTWYPDADGDTWGDAGHPGVPACEPPWTHAVLDHTDCNDAAAEAHPEGVEVCDPADVDEDCDGLADDADPELAPGDKPRWFPDDDGDGYGDRDAVGVPACEQPMSGAVQDDTDCDDSASTAHPGGTEVCDAEDVDEDCDGGADDADPDLDDGWKLVWYPDGDGDGFGDDEDPGTPYCDPPAEMVTVAGDCDDSASTARPGGTEVCDPADVDEDCDGGADDEDPDLADAYKHRWYPDSDEDGFGDELATPVVQCQPVPGYVTDDSDCDDGHASAHPGGVEACDDEDVDEDCDGGADDADPDLDELSKTRWHADLDRDGFGDPDDPGTRLCDPPLLVADNAEDCDDEDGAVYPGAVEVCDAEDVDEDCDEAADDLDPDLADADKPWWYPDADEDGYGDAAADGEPWCDPPPGLVANHADCDDASELANPGYSAEICGDGVDNDCDGSAGSCWSGTFHRSTHAVTLESAVEQEYVTLAVAGDVDGDGQADLVAGGPGYSSTCSDHGLAGTTYLVHGPITADLDLADADAWILGEDDCDYAGISLDVADLSGDGLADVVIGAPGLYDVTGGRVYVFHGPVSSGERDVSEADATLMSTTVGVHLGYEVAPAGDVDGDGIGDLLVGTRSWSREGHAWLVHGPFSSTKPIEDIAATEFVGDDDEGGTGMALVGDVDVDGDGTLDVMVGSPWYDTQKGGAFLFLDAPTGTLSLDEADAAWVGMNWNQATGEYYGHGYGKALAAGDVDGDGYDDALIGAWRNDTTGNRAGAAYLVYGAASPPGDMVLAVDADAVFLGEEEDDVAGASVSVGDLDLDGLDDVSITSIRGSACRACIYLGPITAGSYVLDTADVNLTGASTTYFNAIVPDLTGDGIPDVVMNDATPASGSTGGAIYLFRGGNL